MSYLADVPLVVEVGATAALVALVTLGTTSIAARVLTDRGVVDQPTPRSSHRTAVVRGVGIAMVLPASVGTFVVVGGISLVPIAVAVSLSALGLADDAFRLSALSRLGLQAASAAALGMWVGSSRGLPTGLLVATACMTYVNATNFMDGIDGITGFHAVLAGGFLAGVGLIDDVEALAIGGAALAGGGAGFLPFNIPLARVFPGDAGAYFVGAWIVGLIGIGLRAQISVFALTGVRGLYLADTGTALLRRVRRRENLFRAHREHVYQRLVDNGRSHLAVDGVVVIGSSLTAAGGVIASVALLPGLALLVAVVAVYLALPALGSRKREAVER